MDQQRVQAIRERLEAATPGPWEAGTVHHYHEGSFHDVYTEVEPNIAAGLTPADADLIANAPADLADLLDERDRLLSDLRAARTALDEAFREAEDDATAHRTERELLLAVVEAYERWTGDPDEMVSALRAYRAYRATGRHGMRRRRLVRVRRDGRRQPGWEREMNDNLDLTEAYGYHTPGTLYEYVDYQTGACPDHGARPDQERDPEGAEEWYSLHPLGEDGHYCLDRPLHGQFCRAEDHDDWETPWPCEYAEAVRAAAPAIARQVREQIAAEIEARIKPPSDRPIRDTEGALTAAVTVALQQGMRSAVRIARGGAR